MVSKKYILSRKESDFINVIINTKEEKIYHLDELEEVSNLVDILNNQSEEIEELEQEYLKLYSMLSDIYDDLYAMRDLDNFRIQRTLDKILTLNEEEENE